LLKSCDYAHFVSYWDNQQRLSNSESSSKIVCGGIPLRLSCNLGEIELSTCCDERRALTAKIRTQMASAARVDPQSQALGRFNSLGFEKDPRDTRVVVAMSGGVDSSVVAALLAQQGYDVVGVTLQLYDHGAAKLRKGACCAGQDIHDARDVAAQLGVPHYVLDYEDRFRDRVIAEFARGYTRGETPVPCVACNQKVKFTDLLDMAADLGADALATGHYVRATHDSDGPRLYRAADPTRDQSYFLFATTPEQLSRLRFPLGELQKVQVRDLACKLGLKIAAKPDSQDICFVPLGRYADVVERLEPDAVKPGDIVHIDGRTLGTHQGLFRYTVGQRKGLGLARSACPDTEPLFVVALDPVKNLLLVGPRSALTARRIVLRDVNWIGRGFAGVEDLENLPPEGIEAAVRVRSTRAPSPALLLRCGESVVVEIPDGETAVAPGQACVFYASTEPNARVLGGGFIQATRPNEAAPAGARVA
jgi:tRNA-uridine 2-sulfurtransferase